MVMTTVKQNRKIVQAFLVILAIVALVLAYRWYSQRIAHKAAAPAPAGQQQQQPAVAVTYVLAGKAELAAVREYVGRVEAIQTVDVRPQVAGEIVRVHFKEGAVVKKGDLLFTLDSRQYRSTVDLRTAELASAEANLDRASKLFARLKSADARSIPARDLDTAESDVKTASAAIGQAKAMLSLAKLDLSHTQIRAPISGRVGAAAFTKGNYVTPAGGSLAKIFQIDPIRIGFSVPDRDFLDNFAAFKGQNDAIYDATVRLPNGEVYNGKGQRDFEDNAMDSSGTIRVRLRYRNEQGLLVPGSMVRVVAKPTRSHIGVVVPQEAILADGNGDFVYRINDDDNTVTQARVALGIEYGTMREIPSGVNAGDKIVVRGLQSLRPGANVTPTPQQRGGEKTPAELAMESTHDLSLISGDAKPQQ